MNKLCLFAGALALAAVGCHGQHTEQIPCNPAGKAVLTVDGATPRDLVGTEVWLCDDLGNCRQESPIEIVVSPSHSTIVAGCNKDEKSVLFILPEGN